MAIDHTFLRRGSEIRFHVSPLSEVRMIPEYCGVSLDKPAKYTSGFR
jgi:hypothetical protein